MVFKSISVALAGSGGQGHAGKVANRHSGRNSQEPGAEHVGKTPLWGGVSRPWGQGEARGRDYRAVGVRLLGFKPSSATSEWFDMRQVVLSLCLSLPMCIYLRVLL